MPVQFAGNNRQESQRLAQLRPQPYQRGGAHLHIAIVVEGRIQGVPELFHQVAQEEQGIRQNSKAFFADVGIHQPDGNLQILAAFGRGIAGELDHQRVVGRLERGLPVALGNIQVLAPGLFDFVGNRVVAEIRATGIVPGDWFE